MICRLVVDRYEVRRLTLIHHRQTLNFRPNDVGLLKRLNTVHLLMILSPTFDHYFIQENDVALLFIFVYIIVIVYI